ncbi:MAG: glycine C-acetyltransferase, partial [Dysgonomonas sp.]
MNTYSSFQKHLQNELADIKSAGLYKNERIITSPQGAEIRVST